MVILIKGGYCGARKKPFPAFALICKTCCELMAQESFKARDSGTQGDSASIDETEYSSECFGYIWLLFLRIRGLLN
jgi:hypothetical protein